MASSGAGGAGAGTCLAWDPNPLTKAETAALLKDDSTAGLLAAFGKRISFGTAGLRSAMGAGIANMNDLTVMQASQGICKYIEDTVEDCKSRGIVVGFDHRRTEAVSSRSFAMMTAAVFLSRGFKPFTVDFKNCCAGFMVTASHNPKEDNGFKVYWGNGAMIIPPVSTHMSESILRNLEPWQTYDYTSDAVLGNDLCQECRDEVGDAYIRTVASKCCRRREANAEAAAGRVAYTAMHGVGKEWVLRAFEAFGHPAPVITTAQAEPDPDFPTVRFPNPEEGKGALELAIKAAQEGGVKLILANDPDADRLAVAEVQEDGSVHVFKGDEIGLLFGSWQWRCWREANPDVTDFSNVYMLASTVSSKVLSGMARVEGFQFEDTLTGFKWLGNRAIQLRDAGKTVLLTYEEAIGFCVGDVVKDKDGVCAAAVFTEFYTAIMAEGAGSMLQYLQSLYRRYGFFVSNNGYRFTSSSAIIDNIFKRLRNEGQYWHRCGPYVVKAVRDLEEPGAVDTSTDDGVPKMPTSSAHMITYYFANGCIATIRPSGTEPKIKYYIEMPGETAEVAKAMVDKMAAVIIDKMLEPEKNGLSRTR